MWKYTDDTLKIMYLVFGIITTLWGICLFFILPDSPMKSRLSHTEKIFAIERLRQNMTGIENKVFKLDQLKETVSDLKTWLVVVIIIAGNVPTGATGSYTSTLIKGFGYTSKESALLNIPSGFVAMVSVVASSWFAGRYNNRGWCIVALFTPGVLGGGLMAFLPADNQAGKLAGIYLTSIFGPSKLSIMTCLSGND